jgi:hypothetical protein
LWVKEHGWIVDWLYGGPVPPEAGTFHPTPAMLRFRRCASIKGLARAIGKSTGSMRYWLELYETVSWFRGWLLRGEDAPDYVAVATKSQIGHMVAWCDYEAHCRKAKIHLGDYYHWLRSGEHISTVDLLRWLFGLELSGVFIVGPKLQQLRQEMTPMGICRAAGIDYSTYRKAKSKREVQKALARAITNARAPGHPSRDSVGTNLPPQTIRWIWNYACAARPKECYKRAGLMSPVGVATPYHDAIRQAKALGAEIELIDYLKNSKKWQAARARQTGLVGHLFIPSGNMLRFREVALQAMSKHAISALAREVPAFDSWFIDLVRRNIPPPGASNGQAVAQQAETKKRGRQPALERHRQWKQEHDAGKSLGALSKKYNVTRRAIADGIAKARRAGEVN